MSDSARSDATSARRPTGKRAHDPANRQELRALGVATTTYDLGRQTLLTTGTSRGARWRKMRCSFLAHNTKPPTVVFQLPPNRVVELGLQIER